MKYLLLIYTSEAVDANRTPDQQQANMGAYFSYTEELRNSGSMVGGEALQSISTATSVQVRDGQTMTSDGPFAETKEQLGGFYLVDVENLDDAIQWAAQIPGAKDGTVEVRPLLEFEG